MKKIFIFIILVFLSFHNIVNAAGSSGGDVSAKSDYDRAVNLIKLAKKEVSIVNKLP